MDHEHEETLLDLSDVVHDETIDDGVDELSRSHSPHTKQQSPSASNYSQSPIVSPGIHDTFTGSEGPSSTFLTGDNNFSVEVLEREIATLLNQNATAASAALLSAAAQQRQSTFTHENAHDKEGESNTGAADHIASLGLNISNLAAMLQAAQAQAAENERVAQTLAAKSPEYSSQRQHLRSGDNEPKPTRSAPAFHSLTAQEPSTTSRSKGATDGSDYLYSEGGDEESETEASRHLHRRKSATPSRANSQDPQSSIRTAGTDELPDINDIFQLSASFGPESQIPDSSPIVSHNQPSDPSPSSPSTHFVLSPSNKPTEPLASTSSLPSTSTSTPKRPRRKRGQESSIPHSHTCDFEACTKSFTRRSDLARHMRIHTGERPFLCSHEGCGKTFIQRSALQVHSRVHTGEKPHCCEYPVCGRTFGDSSSLARHRRTHTGKRPYKCENPACEKTFTRRTTLTQHMRTHDPNWAPDPNQRHSFKAKKRKTADDAHEIEESVRTISALLQPEEEDGSGALQQPLEARVASISAEIAAALAQAREYQGDDGYEDEEEDEVFGSGQEMGGPETIGPNTSGIRDLDHERPRRIEGPRSVGAGLLLGDDDDDSDAFPIPLRTRKGKDTIPMIGNKRKR